MNNYSKFHAQVKHYTQIAEKFCQAYLKEFRGHGHFSSCKFEEDEIYINWEDSWSYGGYERDSVWLPVHRLDDWEVYLQELIEKRDKEKLLIENKKKLDEARREKAMLEQLKAKYEQV